MNVQHEVSTCSATRYSDTDSITYTNIFKTFEHCLQFKARGKKKKGTRRRTMKGSLPLLLNLEMETRLEHEGERSRDSVI